MTKTRTNKAAGNGKGNGNPKTVSDVKNRQATKEAYKTQSEAVKKAAGKDLLHKSLAAGKPNTIVGKGMKQPGSKGMTGNKSGMSHHQKKKSKKKKKKSK